MRINRSRKAKTAVAKKTRAKSQPMSKGTIMRIRLLSAAALITLAVMAIVVDAADQSTPKRVASTSTASSSAVSASETAAPMPNSPDSKALARIPDSTYVGCLRVEDDGRKFVLTEVGGKDAPKSRSWKTAFITKKSGKLDVTPAGTMKLGQHVGKTVQITGKRIDNDFTARSLKVIGSTCN